MEGPEGGVVKGHIPHGEIFHVLEKAHPGPIAAHLEGAFVAAAVRVVLIEDLPPAPVDPAGAGDDHVLGVPREKEAAPLPAGIAVVVIKAAHEVGHIGGVETRDKLRPALEMEIHTGLEADGPREESPRRDRHAPAAGVGAGVNSLLDGPGVEGDPVPHRAEIQDGKVHAAAPLSITPPLSAGARLSR